MKTLLLLRHAKSSWKDAALADHDRPLNKRGKAEAPRVGEWLRKNDLVPDLILASTARRAHKTAERVAEASGYAGEVQLEADLYLGDPEDYLDALQGVSDKYECVLVVGHNPGIEEFLELLTRSDELLPTAALAQISLPIEHWRQLTATTKGLLVNLWRPRDEA
jgi:phosphohistidine phosphatase